MFNGDIHPLSPVCVNDVAAVLKSLFFFAGRFTEGSGQVRVPVFWSFQRSWGPGAAFKPRRFPANSGGPFFRGEGCGDRKVRKGCGKVLIRSREV